MVGEKSLGHRSLPGAFVLAALATIVGLAALVYQSVRLDPPDLQLVLVELFTSEGCLSCPPADKLLMRLAEEQPVSGALIVPLSQHVDYWNSVWTDPFSSSVFTDRQMSYHRALKTAAPYTPQMVVDGRFQLVGSRDELAQEVIAKAARTPKAIIQLQHGQPRLDNRVSIQVGLEAVDRSVAGGESELWIAMTEEGLESRVERGENAFRSLRHPPVVREIWPVETLSWPIMKKTVFETVVKLDPSWSRPQLRIVAVLQDSTSRRILGVSQTKIGQLE